MKTYFVGKIFKTYALLLCLWLKVNKTSTVGKKTRCLYYFAYKIYTEPFCLLQPIVYEGQDKNPEMCRVLMTHEVMCR